MIAPKDFVADPEGSLARMQAAADSMVAALNGG